MDIQNEHYYQEAEKFGMKELIENNKSYEHKKTRYVFEDSRFPIAKMVQDRIHERHVRRLEEIKYSKSQIFEKQKLKHTTKATKEAK